jgi:L-lactate dehydrogenase
LHSESATCEGTCAHSGMVGWGLRQYKRGTVRYQFAVSFPPVRQLNLAPRSVKAQVLGEHGTSEVFLWSSAQVAGVPVLNLLQGTDGNYANLRQSIERAVRYANIAIIEGIQASQYGIGMASARIAEIVLRNERAVVPIGSYNPRYGVTLSMPSVLGRDGVVQILEPEMSKGLCQSNCLRPESTGFRVVE